MNVGHSLFVLVPVTLGLAWPLKRAFGLSRRRALAVCAVSLFLHSGMDAFYGGKYMLVWPVSSAREGFAVPHEQNTLSRELAIFPPALLLFILGWLWITRSSLRRLAGILGGSPRDRRGALALTSVILLAAAVTYGLAVLRHHQMRTMWKLYNEGDCGGALEYLEMSSGWPAVERPAEANFYRGLIYWKMGRRDKAEQCLLQSYFGDSSQFWCVAKLADFYASADAPLEWRRRKVEPYLQQLEREFSGHPRYALLRQTLERKLRPAAVTSRQAA